MRGVSKPCKRVDCWPRPTEHHCKRPPIFSSFSTSLLKVDERRAERRRFAWTSSGSLHFWFFYLKMFGLHFHVILDRQGMGGGDKTAYTNDT